MKDTHTPQQDLKDALELLQRTLDALEKAEAETAAAWAKYRTPEATKEDWEAYEEASLKRNTLRDLYEGKL